MESNNTAFKRGDTVLYKDGRVLEISQYDDKRQRVELIEGKYNPFWANCSEVKHTPSPPSERVEDAAEARKLLVDKYYNLWCCLQREQLAGDALKAMEEYRQSQPVQEETFTRADMEASLVFSVTHGGEYLSPSDMVNAFIEQSLKNTPKSEGK